MTYEVGDHRRRHTDANHHPPADRLVDLGEPDHFVEAVRRYGLGPVVDLADGVNQRPRTRRDRSGYRRYFERFNAVRQPDGSLALVPVSWWVRRWRAIRRWVRP